MVLMNDPPQTASPWNQRAASFIQNFIFYEHSEFAIKEPLVNRKDASSDTVQVCPNLFILTQARTLLGHQFPGLKVRLDPFPAPL